MFESPDPANFPLWYATLATFVIFGAIAVGTWMQPGNEIFADAPDKSRWRDLRIWATVLIALQLAIYAAFS